MPLISPLQYYLDNLATVQEAADRFVRASYYFKHLPQPHHYREAVAGVLSVMRTRGG